MGNEINRDCECFSDCVLFENLIFEYFMLHGIHTVSCIICVFLVVRVLFSSYNSTRGQYGDCGSPRHINIERTVYNRMMLRHFIIVPVDILSSIYELLSSLGK